LVEIAVVFAVIDAVCPAMALVFAVIDAVCPAMALVFAAIAVVLEAMALVFAVIDAVCPAMALVLAAVAVVLEAVVVSSAPTLNTEALSAVCKLLITWFWINITCLNSSIADRIENRLLLFEK